MSASTERDTKALAADAGQWAIGLLDVDAYLERVGYDGDLAPTVETRCRLHRAHVAAIPFENLDVVLGRGVSLEVGAMQDKLLRRGRGGYCYEHNPLFAALLERIGFAVRRMTARIRMGSDGPRESGHMLLRVEAEGRPWLADVGFGGQRLLEPPAGTGPTGRRHHLPTGRLDVPAEPRGRRRVGAVRVASRRVVRPIRFHL